MNSRKILIQIDKNIIKAHHFPRFKRVFLNIGKLTLFGHLRSNFVTWGRIGSLGVKFRHLGSNLVTEGQIYSNWITWGQTLLNRTKWVIQGHLRSKNDKIWKRLLNTQSINQIEALYQIFSKNFISRPCKVNWGRNF